MLEEIYKKINISNHSNISLIKNYKSMKISVLLINGCPFAFDELAANGILDNYNKTKQ